MIMRPARRGDVRLREAVVAERPRPAVDHVDVPAVPGHDTDREAAAKDLAVRGDVRSDVEQTLDATLVRSEPGDDLVEHQQEAVVVGEPAQLAEEGHRLQVRIPGPDRLDEHERELGRRASRMTSRARSAAVLEDEGVVDDALGDARHHGHRPQIAPHVRPPVPSTMSLRPWMSSVK